MQQRGTKQKKYEIQYLKIEKNNLKKSSVLSFFKIPFKPQNEDDKKGIDGQKEVDFKWIAISKQK